MEKKLESTLDEIMGRNGVSGVVVANRQGLCLGARGVASEKSSGLWTALSAEASKLEPFQPSPTIILENSRKQCVIQGNDQVIVAVYKERS